MSVPKNILFKLEGAVDDGALQEILAEAHAAPSMAALSPWALVVVEPPFPDILFDGAVEMATPLEVPVQDIAEAAGVMIAVLAEKERPGAAEAAWGVIAVISASAGKRDLAWSIFSPGNEAAALELFKAPSWYRLAGIVALGKPGEELGTYQTKPLDTCVIVHKQGENQPLSDKV